VAGELTPQSGNLRATLGRVAEASVALNGLLAGADKLTFAAPAGLDAERVEDVHETLAQVTKKAEELSSLFPEPDGDRSPDDKAAPPGAEKALDALQELTDECEARVEQVAVREERLRSLADVLLRWGPAVATLLLVWITLGQASLLLHGWTLLRHRRAAVSPPPAR